ncbi:hypothetical protein C627_08755 [Corynebacterium glutamicum ZL-6]|nr:MULTISPECIES: winged helix-turn-helix domain-containing protein [Corynebacterium]ANR62707.1 hypothetical protein C628_08855 [[Brevibacterium] flavum ZL-1]ANR65711.1 hypothetical protein C627_08755 [Corynebacterium glutamicum ZL-6]PST75670.1 hypothetical protein I919_08885 [Corynebacterium glutamicum ZL-2]
MSGRQHSKCSAIARASASSSRCNHGPGEATVSELADIVGVTLPTASAALQLLADNGVVESFKEGRVTRYKLVDATTHTLLHHLGGTHRH